MYKCIECGFEFEELGQRQESRGECFGVPCSETMYGCPNCYGDYEEAVVCEICKKAQFEEDIISGICKTHLEDCKHDFEKCLKLSEGLSEKTELNSLFVTILTRDEIEEILTMHIRKNMPEIDCSAFIEIDEEAFAEDLAKEV